MKIKLHFQCMLPYRDDSFETLLLTTIKGNLDDAQLYSGTKAFFSVKVLYYIHIHKIFSNHKSCEEPYSLSSET